MLNVLYYSPVQLQALEINMHRHSILTCASQTFAIGVVLASIGTGFTRIFVQSQLALVNGAIITYLVMAVIVPNF